MERVISASDILDEEINHDRQDGGEGSDDSERLFDAGHATNNTEDVENDSSDSEELFDAGKGTNDINDLNEGNNDHQSIEHDDVYGIVETPNDIADKSNVEEIELQDHHIATAYI